MRILEHLVPTNPLHPVKQPAKKPLPLQFLHIGKQHRVPHPGNRQLRDDVPGGLRVDALVGQIVGDFTVLVDVVQQGRVPAVVGL